MELTLRRASRFRRLRRVSRYSVVVLVLLAVSAFLLPSALGLSRATVSDDSMSGTVERGSAVFTRQWPVADLEVGDVITFGETSPYDDRRVTRRIAAIDEAGVIWVSGDRIGAEPRPVPRGSTQARAVVEVPLMGYAYDGIVDGAKYTWHVVSALH